MKWYFVIPWYGTDIPGGAEAECRGAATHLKQAGVDVEILTTTIGSFMSDWSKNACKPGLYEEEGLPVRRFAVKPTHRDVFGYINDCLLRKEKITPDEETYFFNEMIRSDDLFDFIERNDKSGIFIFIPYLFTTTIRGALIHPERSLLLPCLHDEPYATLSKTREVFESAAGILFNVAEEKLLANRLYSLRPDRQQIVGIGLDTSITGNADRFREKYAVTHPFILYAGRKDAGKNTLLLIRYFQRFLERHDSNISLVMIGNGTVPIPDSLQKAVIDLGFVSVQDKADAYRAADLFIQPSINESFSIVMMEAWLQKTPVVVHADCPVTRGHCIRSNGGLYFSNYPEFEETLLLILNDTGLRNRMGRAGRQYVLENYTWSRIVDRYKNTITRWFGDEA
jgi:glycosyltransferase involved in cell wall biosynthesis